MSLVRPVHSDGFDYEGPANPSSAAGHIAAVIAASEAGDADDHDDLLNDELLQPWPSAADIKSEWRRLSLAPADVPVEVQEPRIAAYKVSNAKRYLQVATGIVACWLASGIVFGFAALKPVLIAEGVYRELCIAEEPLQTDSHGKVIPCAEQDLRLNLFFIVASITTNVSSLLAGTVLDRYGRRVCWFFACMALVVGAVLLGSSFAIVEFDGYLLGNFFLALGGTFIFVPSYQLTNAFPKHSGIIVALITGSFDASAAVYLLYRIAYDATEGRFTLHAFFFAYTAVPALILAAELAYMPAHGYHSLPELEHKIEKAHDAARDAHDSDEEIRDAARLARLRRERAHRREAKLDQLEELVGDDEVREERVRTEEERQETSMVWGVLHGLPAHRQMATPWFILLLLLTVLQMLRMNYFIATIRAQYRHMLGSEEMAEAVNSFFDVALPLGGVAATPLIGVLLNSMSIPSVFGLLTAFIVAIGVLNCLPFLWAGYATVFAFVIFRPLYYSAISDYATKVFGFSTFGRIYGTLTCISGLFNFAQSGLDGLTHGPFHEDPTPINIFMGAGGALLGAVMTIFVYVRGQHFVEERQEIEADYEQHERQVLLADNQITYGSA
jgi:MFS family permease